jgi:hypothetical protein
VSSLSKGDSQLAWGKFPAGSSSDITTTLWQRRWWRRNYIVIRQVGNLCPLQVCIFHAEEKAMIMSARLRITSYRDLVLVLKIPWDYMW